MRARSFMEALNVDMSFIDKSRVLHNIQENRGIEIILVNPKDASFFVARGFSDFAITAHNILHEYNDYTADVDEVIKLPFGQCRLVVAVRADSTVQSIEDLRNCVVATDHPRLTKFYFQEQKIPINIIHLHGSTETAPNIGLSTGIVQCYETGRTVEDNHLRVVATIMESSAVLIATKANRFAPNVQHFIDAATQQSHLGES